MDATAAGVAPVPGGAGVATRGVNASGANDGIVPVGAGVAGLGVSGFGAATSLVPIGAGLSHIGFEAVGSATSAIAIASALATRGVVSSAAISVPPPGASAVAERTIVSNAAATTALATADGAAGTTSPGIVASGGTLTNDQTWQYHTFTGDGTFTVEEGEGPIEVLLVGGGAAGGSFRGGGGGGGRVILQTGISVSAAVGTYAITVGQGAAGASGDTIGANGGNSTGFGLTAQGGGGGGGGGSGGIEDGANGGCGGGGAGQHSGNGPGLGGTGQPTHGNNGGDGSASTSNHEKKGGGGGGAGGTGGAATLTAAGSGGAGFQTDFNGSTQRYGAGGGGGATQDSTTGGAGGAGGGGAGGDDANGANATGIGAGGGGSGGSGSTGGSGTDGIVIIRYPFDPGTPPPPGEDPAVVMLQSNSEAEFNALYPGGQGHQQTPSHAQCRDHPEVIAIGVDVGSFLVSTDRGATWGVPRRAGLNSTNCQGIAIDPVNPLHWLVYAISDTQSSSASSEHGGLYYSGDGGDTFSQVYQFDNEVADGNHLQCEAICFHPSSNNGTRCMRAYAYLRGNTQNHFVVSTDGGESFSLVASFSSATHGHPRTMAADPSNVNTVYVTAGNSLYRVTNAASSANINFSRRSGTGNLPGGNIYGQPYVSEDGETVIVGVRNIGCFRSVNGADTWTQFESDDELHKLWVNPYNTQRMFITYHGVAPNFNILPRFSTNGGASFNDTSSLERRPGYSGAINSQFEHNHVFYFDTSGEMFLCGRHTFRHQADNNWKSFDSGNTFTLSMVGFSLEGVNAWTSPQSFHPSNPLRFALPYTDLGISWTNNGGQHCTVRRAHQELPDMDHGTAVVAVIHPNGSRVLGCVGRSNRGILVRIEMPSGGAFAPIDKSTRRYHGLCYDADDPDFWFTEQYRSVDGGVSFNLMGALGASDVVWGCTLFDSSLTGGQAIFTIDFGATESIVKRSIDRGGSFQTVLDAGYNLINGIGTKSSPFKPHPRDANILFTQTPNGRGIRRWDLSSGSPSNRPFEDLDPGVPGGIPFRIIDLGIDARFPDNMVIDNQYSNTGHTLYFTDTAGLTWQNLSHLVPGGKPGYLEISQRNGDICFGTTNGCRLLRSPAYDDPDSNVSRIVWPNNVLPLGYMSDFLGL